VSQLAALRDRYVGEFLRLHHLRTGGASLSQLG